MALGRRARGADADFFPGFLDAAEIGVGRIATVYDAHEVATARQVALKLLTVRDASPAAIASFEREALALGAVGSHPHVVTMLRSFHASDGRPVLALELCGGAGSGRRKPGPRVPVDEAVGIAARIAGALGRVHGAGIVHCDVKPSNILYTSYGEPVLADFGAALLPSGPHVGAGLVDRTTPHVAPELLSGGDPSPATDVYGLASTLYELLAGRPAFGGDGARPVPVMTRILHDPVPPLADKAVPGELGELILLAMSKAPEARPSVAEFGAVLEAIEVGDAVPVVRARVPHRPSAPSAPVVSVPTAAGEGVRRRAVRIDEWDELLDT